MRILRLRLRIDPSSPQFFREGSANALPSFFVPAAERSVVKLLKQKEFPYKPGGRLDSGDLLLSGNSHTLHRAVAFFDLHSRVNPSASLPPFSCCFLGMNRLPTLLAGLFGLLPSAQAATVNFSNFNFAYDNSELLFVDNAGEAITEGFVGLYQFGDGAPTDHRSLRANGSDGLLDLVPITSQNAPGGFGAVIAPMTAANEDGSLNDVPLYVVVGDGPDAENSSQFILLETGMSFSKADIPAPVESILYRPAPSHVKIGTVQTKNVNAGAVNGPTSYQARIAKAVPEPSLGIFAFLGGVTLLLRRRR